jgi:hypothetical protein
MKPVLLALALVAAMLSSGCFRVATGRGVIYYEAKTPNTKAALFSRIPEVRKALSSDQRFVDCTTRRGLCFEGKPGGVFDGCSIDYTAPEPNEGNPEVILLVHCPHSIRFSSQARALRKVVESILGASFVAQLNIIYDEGLIDVR